MKTQLKLFIFLTLALAFIWSASASSLDAGGWGPVTNDFQMTIKLKDGGNVISNGGPCVLLISYRNVSTNETFWVYERNGIEFDPEYSFNVVSPSGKDVSPDMEKVLYGDAGANAPVLPSKSIEITFDLGKLCKFDVNGTYKIIAEKKGIWAVKKKKGLKVVSNPLYVTVVPAQ